MSPYNSSTCLPIYMQNPNLAKENQFRNVKVQCNIMMAMVREAKTTEAGTCFWVQVMICLLKGQFVTMNLVTGSLHFNRRPIPRELAIKQPFVKCHIFLKIHFKIKVVFKGKWTTLKSFGDGPGLCHAGLWGERFESAFHNCCSFL